MKKLFIRLYLNCKRVLNKVNLLSEELKFQDFSNNNVKKYSWGFYNNLNSEGLTLSNYKGKSFMLNARIGDEIETTIITNKIWDKDILDLMQHFISSKSKGLVLDIGANIGALSIPLALNNQQITFLCFDPHPVIFKRLSGNIALNNLANVQPYRLALSSRTQQVEFYAQTENKNMGLSSLTPIEGLSTEKILVDSFSGDEFLNTNHPGEIVLIKIDVQGNEKDVLIGLEQSIHKYKPVIVFEHEDSILGKESVPVRKWISDFFEKNNYKLYLASSSIIDSVFFPRVDLTNEFNGNIVAIYQN